MRVIIGHLAPVLGEELNDEPVTELKVAARTLARQGHPYTEVDFPPEAGHLR